MRRLVMVLLGLAVIAGLFNTWVVPLLGGYDVRHIKRSVSDWAKGDNGDFARRLLKPFNPEQP